MKKFTAWRKGLRITGYGVASALVVALFVAVGVFAWRTVAEPRIEKATAVSCTKHFSRAEARKDCLSGNIPKAKATQKKLELRATCEGEYSGALAIIDCENGHNAKAAEDQSEADEAAAAAKKAASIGQSYDNPDPYGTKASMESTNRLDGTEVDYVEWISGFNANWTGYDEFEAPDAGKKYIAFVVNVQATDAGVDAGTVGYDASFTDSNGTVYDHATVEYEASNQMPQVTLGAGQQASGLVVFEVPTSVTSGDATFGDGTVFEALK